MKNWLLLLIFNFVWACSSSKQEPMKTFEVSILSMGVPWKISAKFTEDISPPKLQREIEEILMQYDFTFSDWTEDSELRKLEKVGLDKFQSASPLFLEGLRLSDLAHKMSGGYFDPTVGAVQWKKRKHARGWNLEWRGQEFRFKKNPWRLTFGGIAKGMAVGAIAEHLIQNHAISFTVNGGGGNLAVFENQKITHFANSRVHQYGSLKKLNLLNPIGSRVTSLENIHLKCTNFPDRSTRDSAGLTDALTKAILLNPKFIIPKNCTLNSE